MKETKDLSLLSPPRSDPLRNQMNARSWSQENHLTEATSRHGPPALPGVAAGLGS
jgi:hypothetical protein